MTEKHKYAGDHAHAVAHRVRGRVGAKGELIPLRKQRDEAGLRPRGDVRTEEGRLVVEPLPALKDVLREPPEVVIAPAGVRALQSKLSREAER